MKSLNDSVVKLPGVGSKRQKGLAHLEIDTIEDLLTYFPFRYNDFKPRKLAEVRNHAKVTLAGRVVLDPVVKYFGYRRSRLTFNLLVDGDSVQVTFFNQPWLKKRLKRNRLVFIYGVYDAYRISLTGIKLLSNHQSQRLNAVYSSNRGIHQSTIKKLIYEAYQQYSGLIKTYLPFEVQSKYRLESERRMIHDMHFPASHQAEYLARRTAKFNEFFLFQMRMQSMRQVEKRHRGVQIRYSADRVRKFISRLPYRLTPAQRKVVGEIDYDLTRPVQMNRLLQGDVGSGKTIVAAIAIYATVTAGYQAALMAPTEILAEQHANNFFRIFRRLGVRIALLTGDTKESARRELLPRLANGQIDLVIGTHALIQKDVHYHNLGLAVVDEQHRFGVNQRQALRKKGRNPNLLAMTATPIPRTLAITAYGDMDISIIDQLPAGRKPVITRWIRPQQIKGALPHVADLLNKGQQAYVVAPLIQPSSAASLADVATVYQKLSRYFAPRFKVGLLNGRMKDDRKNKVMQDFKANKIQVLVSTTVIEVGVDVANATLMMIYNAEHFGLSQLHQLRGRVGRGSAQAYCLLVADPKGEIGKKRMNVMVNTDDGFVVSQKDLELRGPGDVLGKEQSGLPNFKVGDPVADEVILQCAQQEAIQVVSERHWTRQPQNRELVKKLRMDYKTNVFD